MKELDLSELASDESFLNFCFQTNSEDIEYWENWLQYYPEYRNEVTELRNAILLIGKPAAEKVINHDYQKLQHSIARLHQSNLGMSRLWPYISAIAAVIALIAIGAYFFKYNFSGADHQEVSFIKDIAPGKESATLTLASGKKIILSNAGNGELAREAGVAIAKTADGKVTYKVLNGSVVETGKMNTLTTAKGESYTIILPDGTKVALNAASSLRYPVSFANHSGDQNAAKRIVTLTGEGYFEVSKDKKRPFVVKTDDQEVLVLGTHFNINAYKNEGNTRTTLLEGSIKISSQGKSQLVRPGEQAVNENTNIKIMPADLDAAIAWQKGKFVFKDESLGSIMRKVERWYDVEVVYDGISEEMPFWGSVSRFENISKILETLQLTESIHFKIEGKKVTVTK